MKTIKLTKLEERVLIAFLGSNPCSGGCALEEMTRSRKDCDECKLQTALTSIETKLGLYD